MFFFFSQIALPAEVSNAMANGDIDLNQIAQLSNGNPVVMLVLGAIGILGGKKLWDWLKQHQEQKHEQKMAQIQISSGGGHEQCVAKQEELEGQVRDLKEKIVIIHDKAEEAKAHTNEIVGQQVKEVSEIGDEVKKLKKKVKKIQEEIEEEEEKKRKAKKRRVSDDD